MTSSTLITTYLGRGLLAARPVSVTVPSACVALYYATDTDEIFYWDGSAWTEGSGVRASLAACNYATAAALAANTYANGASGVGATLTANANGALTVDGVTPTVADRILVKDEAAAANNGVYTVTQVGSGGAPYILTRATDFDTSAEMFYGAITLILAGSTLSGNMYYMSQSAAITVGTTDIDWSIIGDTGGITELTGDVTAGPGSGSQAATIANNAVTTIKILDLNVTTAKIADLNVTTAKIADLNVTTAKIAANNVTTAKLVQLTDGQLFIGSTGNDVSIAALTAGSGVSVTNGAGSITLAARTTAKAQAQWVSGAVVANGTIYFAFNLPYAGTVDSLDYFTGNGSFTVAIKIEGVDVTSLDAVAVSSPTPANDAATGANTFAAGETITGVITSATGSPTDALLNLNLTWS